MAKNENSNSFYTTRRIGATTYKVKVIFKDDGAETMEEKILRLVHNERVTNAETCDIINAPQMSRQSESKITALYERLSRDDDQAGDSNSIINQKKYLESYAAQRGYENCVHYTDDGYSGLNYDRPNFQRMLTDIDNGIVNMVVTKDLSRLGRDYIQTGYYTEIYFANKHVRYIAVNDGYDSNLDNNDMYARDLSRKVKSAKRQRMMNGYYISGQTPYGYMVNPDNRNQLIVDDEAAEVVKRIYSLSLAGYSAKKIAQNLTEAQILTPGAYKLKNGDTRFTRQAAESGGTKWAWEPCKSFSKTGFIWAIWKTTRANWISYATLYGLTLERVQKLAELMRDDDGLMKLIRQKSAGNAKADKLIAKKGKAEKRLNEWSRLLRKLFEDNAKGLLDNRNYEIMMGEYQAEQAALTGKLAEIQSKLAEKADYAGQPEKLQLAVRDCLDIRELTPLVLNKLIDRIEVGSQEFVNGQRQQEIRIIWRFAGEM